MCFLIYNLQYELVEESHAIQDVICNFISLSLKSVISQRGTETGAFWQVDTICVLHRTIVFLPHSSRSRQETLITLCVFSYCWPITCHCEPSPSQLFFTCAPSSSDFLSISTCVQGKTHTECSFQRVWSISWANTFINTGDILGTDVWCYLHMKTLPNGVI